MSTKLIDLWRQNSGNVSIIFGLALLPIITAVGISVDYSRAVSNKAYVQNALDAAAFAAAKSILPTEAEKIAAGETVFATNWAGNDLSGATVTPNISFSGDVVIASATTSVETTLLRAVGINSVNVSASSTVRVGSGKPICIQTLAPTAAHSVEVSGSAGINANACALQVDSSHDNAVTVSGSASVSTESTCIHGGVENGESHFTPPPTYNCPPIGDVLASYPKPAVGSCDYNSFSSNAPTVTLTPGVYCNGINLHGSAAATFEPGIYTINGGKFNLSGGASLVAEGVAFYLTGTNVQVSFSGGSSVRITAPLDGELAGFVFFLDRDAPAHATSIISGSSDMYYEGVIYLPTQEIEVSGSASTSVPSPLTLFLVGSFKYSGTTTLNIGIDLDATSVPLPAAVKNTLISPIPVLVN